MDFGSMMANMAINEAEIDPGEILMMNKQEMDLKTKSLIVCVMNESMLTSTNPVDAEKALKSLKLLAKDGSPSIYSVF